MILYRWQGAARNFGDELNTLLWPHLLPGFFDDEPSARFLGIGSVLDRRHPADRLKIVAGSGYGGYEPPPELDHTWRILWVRGPHTARRIGLPARLGLGDPAALLPLVCSGSARRAPAHPRMQAPHDVAGPPAEAERAKAPAPIGFMPHFESAARGAWHAAASLAGIGFIDPRGDPAAIVEAIGACRILVAEAMHGAIVADALRVPWIAIRPLAPIHRAKWHDWADTLGLRLAFRTLPPSTLLERAQISGLARYHAGRRLLCRHADRLRSMGSTGFVSRAAAALAAVAREAPQLSADAALASCQDRMMTRLDALAHPALRAPLLAPRRPAPASVPDRLHLMGESAYHPGLIG